MEQDDVLDWIAQADPDAHELRTILAYEAINRRRTPILQECSERLARLGAGRTR